MPQKIVITGGPGTGKTSIIKALEEADYICLHEIIRDFTLEAKENDTVFKSNPINSVDNPFDFNTKILNGRLNQYNLAEKNKKSPIFFDRGMPDVLAYMCYFNQEITPEFKDICMKNRYDAIFILPPWEEIYRADNERFETYEEAVDIYRSLQKTYKELNYKIIEVPLGTVEERVNFILEKTTK